MFNARRHAFSTTERTCENWVIPNQRAADEQGLYGQMKSSIISEYSMLAAISNGT